MLKKSNYGITFFYENKIYIRYSWKLVKNFLKIILFVQNININYVLIKNNKYIVFELEPNPFILQDSKAYPSISDLFWTYKIINSKIINYFELYPNITCGWESGTKILNNVRIYKIFSIKIFKFKNKINFEYELKDVGILLYYLDQYSSFAMTEINSNSGELFKISLKINESIFFDTFINRSNYNLLKKLIKAQTCELRFYDETFSYDDQIVAINNLSIVEWLQY